MNHNQLHCFAYREANGTIDIESIAETVDNVKWKMLESSMGWRFEHPERYNQEEQWKKLLAYGEVVPVVVSLRTNQ